MSHLEPMPTDIVVGKMESGELKLEELRLIKLPSLAQCLNDLILPTGKPTAAIAQLASMNKATLHKALNGEMHPSRNALLSIAVVLELSVAQTQLLLKCGEHAELSSGRPRDIVILDCLLKHKTLGDIDDLLREKGMLPLIKEKKARKDEDE